jgi:hypothetical protein
MQKFSLYYISPRGEREYLGPVTTLPGETPMDAACRTFGPPGKGWTYEIEPPLVNLSDNWLDSFRAHSTGELVPMEGE